MKEYARKPESQSRILDSNPRASRQAPIDVILQQYKERNIQRYVSEEDDDLLQSKFGTTQRKEIDEDKLLQGKFESISNIGQEPVQQKERPNNTGLPDNLKKDVENLSGYSMDDVKVHYNSDKPTQLEALAYTQGTDIHVAPGQEKYLSHEAWHVVQQKQGRVQPTMKMQGVNINDNEVLEKEADVMGRISSQNNFKSLTDRMKNTSTTRNTVQRNGLKVKNFFTSFKKNKADNLALFTVVKEDGLGDAGQLGYLYDKLKSINYCKNIGIKTYAVYYIEKNKEKIKELARIDDDSRLVLIENKKTEAAIDKFPDLPNNWIIQYPFPSMSLKSDNMLKITEMGFDRRLPKAGTAFGGIGYGIPNIYTETTLDDNEISVSSKINNDTENFSKAMFVSVKPKEGSGVDSSSILKNLTEFTKTNNIPYLVITKNDCFKPDEVPVETTEVYGSITVHKYNQGNNNIIHGVFSNAFMRFLMRKITIGMIISGGEGMFAESLDTAKDPKNKSIAIIAGRYGYQYSEIALELSEIGDLQQIELTKDNKERYRIFLENDEVIYFNEENNRVKICQNYKKTKGIFSSKS
ncbi:hypothetical protein FACS1894174_08410 [Bacteroidia bacterium]|nr:hypothetical protein FACS1894174_08410 [Bacteroidia bacterium]